MTDRSFGLDHRQRDRRQINYWKDGRRSGIANNRRAEFERRTNHFLICPPSLDRRKHSRRRSFKLTGPTTAAEVAAVLERRQGPRRLNSRRGGNERRATDSNRRNSDLITSLGRRRRSAIVAIERRTEKSLDKVGRRDVLRLGRRHSERRAGDTPTSAVLESFANTSYSLGDSGGVDTVAAESHFSKACDLIDAADALAEQLRDFVDHGGVREQESDNGTS